MRVVAAAILVSTAAACGLMAQHWGQPTLAWTVLLILATWLFTVAWDKENES